MRTTESSPGRLATRDSAPVGWRWTLVTGASSGIGEAFARHLGSLGVNVVLVGRDVGRLRSVAAVIAPSGVRTEVLVADLTTHEGVARVCTRLRSGEPMIDLLVNNAGTGQFGRFVDLPLAGAVEVLRVNNEALVQLTSVALVRMLRRRWGTIVQMSSTASAAPGPQQAVYAASKAFVSSFGQALSEELRGTGVTCTTVVAGRTRTRYFERVGAPVDVPARQWMSAEDVARLAIDAAQRGESIVVPGRANLRNVTLTSMFPSLPLGRALQSVRHVLGVSRGALRAAGDILEHVTGRGSLLLGQITVGRGIGTMN
jgi:short-subunit dehydrogenase